MKNTIVLISLCSTFFAHEQSSMAQEKMEIEGSITLSNSESVNPIPGTLRWTGSDFEGFNGTDWVSLTYSQDFVLDIENNRYPIVKINDQIWMTQNLKVTRYNDGTPIPLEIDDSDWELAGLNGEPAFSWYENEPGSFGGLYNFYAIDFFSNGFKNICPTGWIVPSNQDFAELINFLGGAEIAGAKLSQAGFENWNLITNATLRDNQSKFNGLPGGQRSPDGFYYNLKIIGSFWTRTENDEDTAYSKTIGNNFAGIIESTPSKKFGNSIRCIKNQ